MFRLLRLNIIRAFFLNRKGAKDAKGNKAMLAAMNSR